MSHRGRYLTGTLAIVALLAALAVAASLLSAGPSDEHDGPVLIQSDAPALLARDGLVIIDGERLVAPYEVTTQGTDVLINDQLALSFAPLEYTGSPVDAAADNTAFEIVDQLRLAYVEAGTGDPGLAAARAMLDAHPAAPGAAEHVEPHRIEVTDANGVVAAFRLETPDADARPVDQATAAGRAAETAEQWHAHLGGGGGLVASTRGVTLLVPAPEVDEFIAALDRALALTGARRDQALAELFRAHEFIEEHGGTPPDPLTASRGPASAHPIRLAPSAVGLDALPLQAAPGHARTPGRREAVVIAFTKLSDADSEPFMRALRGESYPVYIYRNPRDTRAFRSSSGTGALYLITHSSPFSLSVASFPSTLAAALEFQRMQQARIPRGHFDFWQDKDGVWWLDLSWGGILANWESRDTIVHAATCRSADLALAFRAREFFGYTETVTCSVALPDTRLLWGRWSGEIGEGVFRSARRAWAQGGFSENFRHRPGLHGEDTVLSPSVILEEAPDVAVGDRELVRAGFDAVMAWAPADHVLQIDGCASIPTRAGWDSESVVVAPIVAEEPGVYTVTVRALAATSERARIPLDGNRNPAGLAGVIPNRDDHVFEGECVTATDGPGIDVRQPTLQPIEARFDPPAQTTTYRATFAQGWADEVVFRWGEPDCGDWSIQMEIEGELDEERPDWTWGYFTGREVVFVLNWHHPHPPCDPTTDHSHITITLTVENEWGTTITCSYQGAHSGTGPPCDHDISPIDPMRERSDEDEEAAMRDGTRSLPLAVGQRRAIGGR